MAGVDGRRVRALNSALLHEARSIAHLAHAMPTEAPRAYARLTEMHRVLTAIDYTPEAQEVDELRAEIRQARHERFEAEREASRLARIEGVRRDAVANAVFREILEAA